MSLTPLVLCYHSVAGAPRGSDPHHLTVTPGRLRSQLELLRARGYRFVTASEVGDRVSRGTSLDGLCALTFDDGIADNAEVLPRILADAEACATLFVCAGLLGRPHPDYPADADVRIMSAEQLLDLATLDFVEVGSHTDTHVALDDASEEVAYREMASSRATLEAMLDAPVTTFAYPRGGYSPGCPPAAERAGYVAAFTVGPDRGAWRRFELPRVMVESWDRRLSFEAKTRGVLYPAMRSRAGRAGRAALRSVRGGVSAAASRLRRDPAGP